MNSIKKPQKLEKSAHLDLVVFVMKNLGSFLPTRSDGEGYMYFKVRECPGVTGNGK